MTDVAAHSLTEIAALFRARAVTPLDATQACLERVAALAPRLNAFVTLTPESARDTAEARGEELTRDVNRGPLHGVPLAVKDLFFTRSVATTAGSRVLRDFVPHRTATCVARLEAAGAVMLGKLHMHEFAYGPTGENPHFAACRNPVDPERLPGGSSSGSAVAVAAGMCFGALGSDTGGSIRIPAALCGTVGLKPTYGAVPTDGVIPLSWSLDHVGPLTRKVDDAALLFSVLSGRTTVAATELPRGMRVGLPEELWSVLQPGVRAAAAAAVQELEAAGAEVIPVRLPLFEVASAAQSVLLQAEATAFHRAVLRLRWAEYSPDVRRRLFCGLFLEASDVALARRVQARCCEEVAALFRAVDVLAAPTVPITAPRFGQARARIEDVEDVPRYFLTRNTFYFNLTGLPAVSVPCGGAADATDEQGPPHVPLPVGLQVVGPPHGEDLVLTVASVVERGCQPPSANR